VTTILRAEEVLAVPVVDGQARVVLQIQLPDRVVKADIAAKSLRRVQAAIREAGTDGVALVLQGTFVAGDAIAEAGLSAQPKVAKKETVAA
jgi:hypothetical protein